MMVMHLTETTYQQLLEGTLEGPEGKALSDHLETDCEACEAFLAGRDQADRLDGAIDAALASLIQPPSRAGAGNDLEFARIERVLRAPSRPRRGVGLALAAAVLVAGVAGLLLPRAPTGDGWDGVKGRSGETIPLRLRFLVLTPTVGGPPGLEQGVSGQVVPAAASLQFQVQLGRAAYVLLARTDSRGAPEIFLTTRLPAGRSVVSLDGQPAAYPLAALAGPQRFLALASEAPLGPADAARAASLGSAARSEDGPLISLDLVEVKVRP